MGQKKPGPAPGAGERAELELRSHFEGRRDGQRIKVSVPVEVVCLERNVVASTIDLSRSGALLQILEGGDRSMAELIEYCAEIDRLFRAGGTIDFECGVTRTIEAIRATAGGLGGRTVPMLACRFKEALTPADFAAIGVGSPDDEDKGGVDEGFELLEVQPGARGAPGKRKVPAVQELLRWAVERQATDIHIKAGSPPRMRIGMELEAVGEALVTEDDARAMVRNFLTDEQWAQFEESGDLDLGFALEGVARFRINVLRSRKNLSMVLRRIPLEVPRLEDLGISLEVCEKLCKAKRGLVLVTGGTGSGKSTTLAAMLRRINETRRCHIVTLEDPVEFVHEEYEAQVTQREIGSDTAGYHSALKRVLRQDPDVIMVGEMRDLEAIKMVVTAAETGHLVFATLHTTSAAQTVDRIVDVFPAEQQHQIRVQLASTLKGILCQTLLPTIDGGVAVAQECLVMTDAVRALVRDGKSLQVRNAMQTGGSEGMQTLEDRLNQMVREEIITYETAVDFANAPSLIREPEVEQAPEPEPPQKGNTLFDNPTPHEIKKAVADRLAAEAAARAEAEAEAQAHAEAEEAQRRAAQQPVGHRRPRFEPSFTPRRRH